MIGSFSSAAIAKLKAQGNNALLDDLIIDANPTPNQSKPVEIMPGTFNATP